MAFIGANGSVTSIPNSGEKLCVGCDHWKGERELSYNNSGATSYDGSSAYCDAKKNDTFPNQPCTCFPPKFKKWRDLN